MVVISAPPCSKEQQITIKSHDCDMKTKTEPPLSPKSARDKQKQKWTSYKYWKIYDKCLNLTPQMYRSKPRSSDFRIPTNDTIIRTLHLARWRHCLQISRHITKDRQIPCHSHFFSECCMGAMALRTCRLGGLCHNRLKCYVMSKNSQAILNTS